MRKVVRKENVNTASTLTLKSIFSTYKLTILNKNTISLSEQKTDEKYCVKKSE